MEFEKIIKTYESDECEPFIKLEVCDWLGDELALTIVRPTYPAGNTLTIRIGWLIVDELIAALQEARKAMEPELIEH